MRIIITRHAQGRLQNLRQQNITVEDVITAAGSIPGRVAAATRFRGFIARSGRMFDLVAKDTPEGRVVITVIGK